MDGKQKRAETVRMQSDIRQRFGCEIGKAINLAVF